MQKIYKQSKTMTFVIKNSIKLKKNWSKYVMSLVKDKK